MVDAGARETGGNGMINDTSDEARKRRGNSQGHESLGQAQAGPGTDGDLSRVPGGGGKEQIPGRAEDEARLVVNRSLLPRDHLFDKAYPHAAGMRQ